MLTRCFFMIIACLPAFAEKPLTSEVLPPPKNGGVYVVCHRGAHENIPENTLAAYQRGIDLGADYVEIDLRTTKDGEIVSVHNATVDSYTSDAKGKVSEFTLAELKAMDIGSRVGPQWKDERIPTFEEILTLCKGKIGIYLDLKEADVAVLLRMIQAHGMEKEIIWYCDPAEHTYLRDHCADCTTMPDPGPEKFLSKILEEYKPDVVASVWRHFSPTFVTACHEAGAIVIVDESDPSCWEEAVAWGSDGVQTDHPEDFINFLKARATQK